MKLTLAGLIAALGCSLLAMEARAQTSYVTPTGYAYPSSGSYVPGSVLSGQVLSQPAAPGTVVGGPVVTGGALGQPVVTGEAIGQPIAGGGVAGQPTGSGVVIGGPVTYVGTSTALPAQGQVLPYSYWVSSPSRIYVEYGPSDHFPFHGRPYGSPNDRWSWYTLGGGSSRYLAKYYYPILR
jgi:hypothetical protein